ncbi:MAG TPA: hypothetical protein VF647_09420 [Longimicrobium sp.]
MRYLSTSSGRLRKTWGIRVGMVAAGAVWLALVSTTLPIQQGDTVGPYTLARRWALAGCLLGLAIGWMARGRRRVRNLLALATVTSGVFAATFAPVQTEAPMENFLGGAFVGLTMFALPILLVLYGLRGGIARSAEGEPAPLPAAAPDPQTPTLAGLREDEERIRGRLREIAAQRQRLDAADALLARELDAATRAPIRARLDHARGVLGEQEARHEARLWSIALVHWQHRLAPLAETRDTAGTDPRARLDALAAIERDGRALLDRWRANGDAAATHEGERCITHMRDLLERCSELRQQIAVEQAMLALRGISPDEDERRTTALSTEPLESLRTSRGLAAELAALEMEHARLAEDHDEARDVERFLRELEGKAGGRQDR